jgi:hypothetical protein
VYAGLPRITWYVPENPNTSKVRFLVRKFHKSPNVTGRLIYPIGSASIPGMTPWNIVVDGRSWDHGMPMSSSVDA